MYHVLPQGVHPAAAETVPSPMDVDKKAPVAAVAPTGEVADAAAIEVPLWPDPEESSETHTPTEAGSPEPGQPQPNTDEPRTTDSSTKRRRRQPVPPPSTSSDEDYAKRVCSPSAAKDPLEGAQILLPNGLVATFGPPLQDHKAEPRHPYRSDKLTR